MSHQPPNAVAFFHRDGLKPTWQMAMRFAGKDGHIATLPEIIEARLQTKPGDVPWETYFTTSSAEYVGFDWEGKKKIVVAHGVGPMSTLDGIMKAYAWEYKDKTRSRRGGRITQKEFLKLIDGDYGEVQIVDFDTYLSMYDYPFLEQITYLRGSLLDTLLKARLGSKALEYLGAHMQHSRRWHAEQAGIDPENIYNLPGNEEYLDRRREMHLEMASLSPIPSDPYILQMGDASNCSYEHHKIEGGMAFAHLLSIGALTHLHHTVGRTGYESLVSEVSAHEWSNGTRFVGIRPGETQTILEGPKPRELLLKNWKELMEPADGSPIGIRVLMQLPEGTWFTQYEKAGAALDTHEPEYLVTHIEKVGEPVMFRTQVWGYYGFFKYLIQDVEKLAPIGTNAYEVVGEAELDGGHDYQKATVQFYQVQVDTTQRLKRENAIANDFDLLMWLRNL